MGRKIIPPNLGLDRTGDGGDGSKCALSVTSDYTPITCKMCKIYTADVTAGQNGSEDLLGLLLHEAEITNKTRLLRWALQTCIENWKGDTFLSVSGAAMQENIFQSGICSVLCRPIPLQI